MTEKITGIVIDNRRHNDTTSIVTLLTPGHGRLVFLSPVSSTRAGRVRQARLFPLSVIETEFRFKPSAEFHRLGSIAPAIVWKDIYSNPLKRLSAVFLADFLNRLLRAAMPDENAWNFIVSSLRYLDSMDSKIGDFLPAFMCSFLPFAGIQPDYESFVKGFYFDMREGIFVLNRPPHDDFLQGEEAEFAALTSRISFSNIKALKLTEVDHLQIIRGLLKYYSIHYPGVANLKTLELLC